jgi:hypothetical protein
MPAHELISDTEDDVCQSEFAVLFSDLNVDEDMDEKVTQLLTEMSWIRLLESVHRLAGFFE